MLERANKTLICSVAYLDIVDYTSRPVPQQLRLKARLNEAIAAAIQTIPPSDRVLLDTGDGAALCFLADPEDALFSILSCRERLQEMEQADPLNMGLRMGINLGPVRLVKDINGQPNLLGDGVNAGERVMSFAEPGQIMASRSYVDVVAHLSQEYGQLFQYQGKRTDKHVREHEVYEICMSKTDNPSLAQELQQRHNAGKRMAEEASASKAAKPGAAFWAKLEARVARWQLKRQYVYGPLLLVILMVTGYLYFGTAEQSVQQPDVVAVTTPPAVSTGQGVENANVPVASDQPEKEKPKIVASPTGTITLAISPWGEVYLDGKKKGVSPPLMTLKVSPGKHTIEVLNTEFTGYKETVDIKAQEMIKIKHKFH